MSNPVDYTNNPANSNVSAYLGFWNDVELYDRFGTTHTYKIGSFLIAITDLPVEELSQLFKNIQTEISDTVIIEYDQGSVVPINYEQASVTQIDVAQSFLSAPWLKSSN